MAVGVAAEVKTKLTVLEVVGETVQLKKAGTTWKGLCPFHGEKTASFIVTPARESWHCFGCGEGGDIFTFVMRRDGLAFPEALRRLAARAGVEIDERTSREDAHRKRQSEVMEAAFAFYHAVLTKSETGAAALAYLRSRGFADETIERFQLGFAPDGWDSLVRQLAKKRQIGAPELIEVGLAQARGSGRGAYDRFRSRVLFPIRDATGNATGLGGRILPPEPAPVGVAAEAAVALAEPTTAAEAAASAPGAPRADSAASDLASTDSAEFSAVAVSASAPAGGPTHGVPSPAGDAHDGIGFEGGLPARVLESASTPPPSAASAPAAGASAAAAGAAVGARDQGPKYLNSPATPLFDKSRTLYPLDRARHAIRKTGTAVIVEGYTDALMAHQAGFENVVASLGTALTPGQVALLTRYATHRIVLAYDVDPAGERAGTLGVTALEQLTRQLAAADSGVELHDVCVARLPDGKDPDEVIRENPDAWREAIRTASPIVEYLVDYHAKRFDLRTTGGRARFVDAILPIIRPIKNPVLRDEYLQRLRLVSGVEERVLLQSLARAELGAAQGTPGHGTQAHGAPGHGTLGVHGSTATTPGPGGAHDSAGRPQPDTAQSRISAEAVLGSPDAFDPKAVLRVIDPVEAVLLRFLLLVPETQEATAERLPPDHLLSQPARELWKAILAVHENPPYTTERVFTLLTDDPETQALMIALLERRDALTAAGGSSGPGGDLRQATQGIEQCLLRLELDRVEARARWTRVELGEAERDGDNAAIERLMHEEHDHNDKRRSLHRRIEQASLLNRPGTARGAATAAAQGTRPTSTANPAGGTP